VQLCEGIWRNRCGQRLLITQSDPDDEQQWTDGHKRYSDNGSYYGRDEGKSINDLVEYIGPFPQSDQAAESERLQSEARNTADAETAEYAARLEGLLDNTREALRDLQEDHTAMDHRAEGARSAYLAVIKTLWEMRR